MSYSSSNLGGKGGGIVSSAPLSFLLKSVIAFESVSGFEPDFFTTCAYIGSSGTLVVTNGEGLLTGCKYSVGFWRGGSGLGYFGTGMLSKCSVSPRSATSMRLLGIVAAGFFPMTSGEFSGLFDGLMDSSFL